MNKSMTEGINGQNAGEKTQQRKGYETKPRERVLGQLYQPLLLQGSPPVSQCIACARQALGIGGLWGHAGSIQSLAWRLFLRNSGKNNFT